MAKKFTFDDAITTDIKGAASNSYIDNIKMIKIADIETNAENFYSLPDIEDLAEDIDRQGLIHSLAVAKISSEKYKLISGHRRLTAIKLLIENGKWNNETVPCYVITAKKSDAEMNLDLIMLNHTQRKYSDSDIFKEHEELKKIFYQLEADGVEIKGRLREKIAKAMHVSSAQIGKIENIKNKIQLLSDLDEAKESCKSKSEFISFLKNKNYEVRYEKHITVHKIGEKKAIRVDTLAKQFGSQYTKAELEKAMGYSTNLADTNTSNLNLQSKKTCARKNINEWQRFESWSFSQDNRYANNYRCLTKQYRTNYHTSRFPTGTRKSILFTILCALFISPNRKKYREHKSYRLSNRTTDDTNIIRTKYWCENIRYGDLISAQGNNFAVKIPADQLGKIIVLPIFYSANVNLETKTAVITVKENNKEIICKALGYDSKQVEQQSDKLINSQKYKRLKDLAASSNTKLSYMIVTKIQLELLKLNEIELAAFPKDDGKYNVAFMPDTKELITKILYPADESKQETEYERNNRLNKEIKRLAAVNGEKPKYRMVAPELLDNIKRSGIQFAYFKKGDKYNIVFLRKNETEIDQLLKQLRKEK